MLFALLLSIGFAQMVDLNPNDSNYVQTNVNEQVDDGNGGVTTTQVTRINPAFAALFSEKFSCFRDEGGMYLTWAQEYYPSETNTNAWYCCGYMANGRRQCDKMNKWKKIGDNHFALCENTYQAAFRETVTAQSSTPKLRRDLCCENSHFNDCNLCKSFMVWDFTVPTNSMGGDRELERELAAEKDGGKVTFNTTWRDAYYSSLRNYQNLGYPPYAYDNDVYPAGFAHATLREFNDPPVCVYAPNVAGRVIEVKVEPEESGSQVCVDDMHEDSLERNTPGVTQACDDSKLQTCFPDANAIDTEGGFAFLISCSESCADGDVDLWLRLRASVNKWTESGRDDLGTDQSEFATEMWCMWGNQDMRDDEENANFPDAFPSELDGNFAKWDVFPSDLTPDQDPEVRPVESGVSMVTLGALLSILALFF